MPLLLSQTNPKRVRATSQLHLPDLQSDLQSGRHSAVDSLLPGLEEEARLEEACLADQAVDLWEAALGVCVPQVLAAAVEVSAEAAAAVAAAAAAAF